jgi:hypothetical protein
LTTIIKMWYNGIENLSNWAAAPARKIIPHLNTFCQEAFVTIVLQNKSY